MIGTVVSPTLHVAVTAESITSTEHDSNKELVGKGLVNLVSGLFRGIVDAGATTGRVMNIQAGNRSAFSGIRRIPILLVVILAGLGLLIW